MLSAPVSPVVPRRGESLTAAIFRQLDPLSGWGLSEPDRMVLNAQQHAADRATIADLRDQLAAANELIAELQQQLDDARTAVHLWAEIAQ